MRRVLWTLAIAIGLLGLWAIQRANEFGLKNVFSREQVFIDERPLTEEVAIELTKRALETDGHASASMMPYAYGAAARVGMPNSDQFFARTVTDQNDGYVLWAAKSADNATPPQEWEWMVQIKKTGSEVRCRALRGK